MKERSIVIIKPDAVIDRKNAEIKEFLVSKSMNIIQEKKVWLTAETLKSFYQCPIPKDSFDKMVKLYTKNFAILILFEGESAIAVGQEAKNLFRKKYNYGYYGSTIHAADSAEEYEREIEILVKIVGI